MRAPDAGDAGAIPSLFLRLILFPVGRRSAARPSAGNANRWAFALQSKDKFAGFQNPIGFFFMKYARKWFGLKKIQEPAFTGLVKLHYAFLEEEFGFATSTEKGDNDWGEPFADGVVKFQIPKLLIIIFLDRDGSTYVYLSSSNPLPQPFYYQTSLGDLVDFFSQGNDRTLRNLWLKRDNKRRSWIERQIIADAQALQKYSHQIFDKESFEWLDLVRDDKKQAQLLYDSTPATSLA
jgi:hypothetical protein